MKKKELEQYADLFVEFWEEIKKKHKNAPFHCDKIYVIENQPRFYVFNAFYDNCLFCEMYKKKNKRDVNSSNNVCHGCPIFMKSGCNCMYANSWYKNKRSDKILETIKEWRDGLND